MRTFVTTAAMVAAMTVFLGSSGRLVMAQAGPGTTTIGSEARASGQLQASSANAAASSTELKAASGKTKASGKAKGSSSSAKASGQDAKAAGEKSKAEAVDNNTGYPAEFLKMPLGPDGGNRK